ncbi:hypothetical protein SAMN05444003_2440 [Cognatiyoonia sediminum]|uniref:Uncharacterized protein n=1 Tax=Cognatiyoonia sediminum TaxID=1508389 RepID=A0A1M5R0I4_9RHOB|nr:hypothetical protein SAMN05444003_2440 [Cognatiyoonia sediminum]
MSVSPIAIHAINLESAGRFKTWPLGSPNLTLSAKNLLKVQKAFGAAVVQFLEEGHIALGQGVTLKKPKMRMFRAAAMRTL